MDHPSRRTFVKTMGAAGILAAMPVLGDNKMDNTPTIQNVIDKVIMECTGSPLKETVDVVKAGDPDMPVKGIAITFLATCDIIEQAAAKGCNFIITHEPTFYNHLDQTDWLANDPVYQHKRDLINKHNMVVWRCHDYIHSHKPDGIMEGMKKQLGWESYQSSDKPYLYELPSMTLQELADQLKTKFNIPKLLAVGDPDLPCKTVAFSMGAPGGQSQMRMAAASRPDVLICGEINEWETNIYFKDANHAGIKSAMVLLGHRFSEEAGMHTVEGWVNDWYPQVETHFISCKEPFQYL